MDYLTITSPNKNHDNKHGIILLARVHPGETVSSWMMKGALDFITGDSDDAQFFRNNFIIKVIPMLNPDGVICGNFRTSVSGSDLNRRWKETSQKLYPEVYHTKEMILKMSTERNIDLVVDMHGHSGEFNIFIYGNIIKNNVRECKIYPYTLSKVSDIFFYSLCKFKMQKFKRGTARISLFNEIGPIPNIVCVEASAAGSNAGKFKNMHWSCANLMTMGRDFFKGFLVYMHSINHPFIKAQNNNTKDNIKLEIDEAEEEIQRNNEIEGKTNSDSESGGSDSEPSIDKLNSDQLLKYLPCNKKRKVGKSKKKKPIYLKKPKEDIKVLESPKPRRIEKIVLSERKKEDPKICINININITKFDRPVKEDKFIKPVSQPSISFMELKTKSLVNKVNAETQTEDVFFKLPWTFFRNKYKIIVPQSSISLKASTINLSTPIEGRFGNYTSKISKSSEKLHQHIINHLKNSNNQQKINISEASSLNSAKKIPFAPALAKKGFDGVNLSTEKKKVVKLQNPSFSSLSIELNKHKSKSTIKSNPPIPF